MYILDEPTTGMHFADIDRLLESLNRLVDHGHSVVVIEHNLDVIKTTDYVINLGPEGGHKGGELIACGTPEEIAACKAWCSRPATYGANCRCGELSSPAFDRPLGSRARPRAA